MTSNEATPENRLSVQLERLLISLHASSRALVPGSQDDLLRSIVETAARIFGAAASSIALVNEAEQTLDFKVAFGAGNENVEGMSIPLDSGIAGYVAMTGQPIAISDVSQDPRFHKTFAKSTGYVPNSILATPLLSGDRVIGVMEVLDKIEAPYFSLEDMDLLGLFARQAAIAIHQSQQIEQFGDLFLMELKNLLLAEPGADSAELLGVLERAKQRSIENPDLSDLVSFFCKIRDLGEAEIKVSLQVLSALTDYWQTRIERTR